MEDLFGNATQTYRTHNGTTLILDQITKLEYKSGENITVTPELVNIGNRNVDISYWEPLTLFEIKDSDNKIVWPKINGIGFIPEWHDVVKIKPGEDFIEHQWRPGSTLYTQIREPGNYTVRSVAFFTFDAHTKYMNSVQPLWSKPLQITVLPEKYVENETDSSMPNAPEFPFAVPVLLISAISAIVFSRMKN
ncbi:MAG: hypothetical protein KGH88_06605, partial [Thaumarchaeota archaeon]|nr:hypothetical protein [Nitrososphaerota archaeon]